MQPLSWTKLSLHAADREVLWMPFAPLEQSLWKVTSMLDNDVTDIKCVWGRLCLHGEFNTPCASLHSTPALHGLTFDLVIGPSQCWHAHRSSSCKTECVCACVCEHICAAITSWSKHISLSSPVAWFPLYPVFLQICTAEYSSPLFHCLPSQIPCPLCRGN